MNSSELELVTEVFTIATLPNNTKVIFQINQICLDKYPLQTEVFLQLHQVRSFGLVVDDYESRYLALSG